jgi:PAS domain S-box-containing protein
MFLKDIPIRKKLMTVILTINGAVLLLTCSAYFAYEFITFRQTTINELSTLGEIIAANSTAALAFDNSEEANEILSAVRADQHIVAASLYNADGKLFSYYPDTVSTEVFPILPEVEGYRFHQGHVIGYEEVVQGNKRLGTLFLKSDTHAVYDRLLLYGFIAIVVISVSLLLAYLLSSTLEKQISTPVLALANTVKSVSEHHNYSVRATKLGHDEIGVLTDAFNHMLARIEKQNIDLSESEMRVRAMINSALSAVVVINSSGKIIDWNVRAEKMFGWTYENAIGRELAETIVPPQFREAHRKGLKHFFTTGEGLVLNQLVELSAIRSDGSEFPIELSISVIKTDGTDTFCGFITDITERKRAEEAIRLFNQKLEQMVADRTQELEIANKELEAFSYSVSHDLRAPLRSIHGYMNIFSEEYSDKVDDEARRLIDIILKNSQKMGQLIDDLLAFSHLGRRDLTKGTVSIKDMATNIWEEQRKMEPGREITCTIQELPQAYADGITIKQVWVNLISNAIKYSRNTAKAVIEIGFEDKDDCIIYYVKDNGAGFDMQYYSKLFGVFSRLHSFQEFDGTGVGLAIVRRIIEKHNGTIWAEGKINEGATFYFSIPKKPVSAA